MILKIQGKPQLLLSVTSWLQNLANIQNSNNEWVGCLLKWATQDCTITDNTFSVSWKIGYTESHNYILLSFYSISITDYNGLESFLTKFSMMVCSTHSLLLMGLQGYLYIKVLHHTKIMHGWHSFIDGRDLKDRNSRRVETRLSMLFTPMLPGKATCIIMLSNDYHDGNSRSYQ